jgi:acetyltransferase
MSAQVATGVPVDPASSAVLLRELTPADRPALVFMFRRLGETSRYQRFLGIKRELSARDLEWLTDVDHWHREAVMAWSPRPRAPIGVARYVRCDEFDVAELAITVVDDWQDRGIGSALLGMLRERAIRAGIRRATATVLRDNPGALALARRFGSWTVTGAQGGVMEMTAAWR